MNGPGERAPEKRAAFESPTIRDRPRADASMARPIATTSGAALVLMRVAAGFVWVALVALDWSSWVSVYDDDPSDLGPEFLGVTLVVFVVVCGGFLLGEAVFGLLILRGRNFPRVVVMVFAVVSISTSFAGWWAQGQDIRLHTTLVTLALDILILLALSSRGAAAYAHRRRRD